MPRVSVLSGRNKEVEQRENMRRGRGAILGRIARKGQSGEVTEGRAQMVRWNLLPPMASDSAVLKICGLGEWYDVRKFCFENQCRVINFLFCQVKTLKKSKL